MSRITTATASRRGVRPHNCDAAATWQTYDRTVAAVVDGIGNTAQVAYTSRLLADVIVRTAAAHNGMTALQGVLKHLDCLVDGRADRPKLLQQGRLVNRGCFQHGRRLTLRDPQQPFLPQDLLGGAHCINSCTVGRRQGLQPWKG